MSLRKKECAHCGNDQGKLKCCNGCHLVWYCNRKCQQSDWKCHQKSCKKVQQLRKRIEKEDKKERDQTLQTLHTLGDFRREFEKQKRLLQSFSIANPTLLKFVRSPAGKRTKKNAICLLQELGTKATRLMQRGLSGANRNIADLSVSSRYMEHVNGCIVLKGEIVHFLEQINSGTYKYDGPIDHEKQAALTRLFTTRNREEMEHIKQEIDGWENTNHDSKKKSDQKIPQEKQDLRGLFDAVVATVKNPSFCQRIENEGRVFTSNNCEKDATGKYGEKGCWRNVAADFSGTIYIGWVATPIPIQHAWLVDGERVIERTPNFLGEYVYFGVPIDRREYLSAYSTTEHTGKSVLDVYAKANMYICGMNNFGTIYLFENPSGISLYLQKSIQKSIHTIPWTDTQLKGFTVKDIPFLIHPKHGSIKVKFPEETDVKELILSASDFDYEFDLGLGEKRTNSSQVHCFEATTCEQAVGKMAAWLEKFPWSKKATDKPFNPPDGYNNCWGEGAKEFALQLIEKWGISRKEFWKLHFNYVQMLPYRVLTGEIRITDRHKTGLVSFQSWYEQHKHDPETLYKFTNGMKKNFPHVPLPV